MVCSSRKVSLLLLAYWNFTHFLIGVKLRVIVRLLWVLESIPSATRVRDGNAP